MKQPPPEVPLLDADFNLRILIVEDDQGQYLVWDFLFKTLKTPYVIEWVTTYKDAVKAIQKSGLERKPIDVIISDIFLADEGTGIDLWRTYHNMGRYFFITSGVPELKFQLAMRDEDAQKPPPLFIPKPIVIDDCRQMLESIFMIQNYDPKKRSSR